MSLAECSNQRRLHAARNQLRRQDSLVKSWLPGKSEERAETFINDWI